MAGAPSSNCGTAFRRPPQLEGAPLVELGLATLALVRPRRSPFRTSALRGREVATSTSCPWLFYGGGSCRPHPPLSLRSVRLRSRFLGVALAVPSPRLLRRLGDGTAYACVFWVNAPDGRNHPENAPPICAPNKPHSAPFHTGSLRSPVCLRAPVRLQWQCYALPSDSKSAVLGWRSGACSRRLRVPWLTRSPPPRVVITPGARVHRRTLRRVPARRWGRYASPCRLRATPSPPSPPSAALRPRPSATLRGGVFAPRLFKIVVQNADAFLPLRPPSLVLYTISNKRFLSLIALRFYSKTRPPTTLI